MSLVITLPGVQSTHRSTNSNPNHSGNGVVPQARLRVRTLGRFEMSLEDRSLQLPSRLPRRPLGVLKVLLAFGPYEVGFATLAAQLWPDLEGDAARNACHVAIHRLRKFLGAGAWIEVEQGRVALDARSVWVDIVPFRRLTDGITSECSAGTQPDAARAASLAQELLSAYPGHFLPDEEAGWAVGAREQLRSRFLRSASVLGEVLTRVGAFDAAVDLYRRGIELDALAEVFHRGLIRTLSRSGRNAEAMDAYRRCRDLFSAALGMEPSVETRNLHRCLLEARGQPAPGRPVRPFETHHASHLEPVQEVS